MIAPPKKSSNISSIVIKLGRLYINAVCFVLLEVQSSVLQIIARHGRLVAIEFTVTLAGWLAQLIYHCSQSDLTAVTAPRCIRPHQAPAAIVTTAVHLIAAL